jgi:hypothetical protein
MRVTKVTRRKIKRSFNVIALVVSWLLTPVFPGSNPGGITKNINMKFLILDDDTNCEFLTDEITKEIEDKIIQGYYRVIDLETFEVIVSNRNGLFRSF